MTNRKKKSNTKWYDEPIKRWFSILSGFIFVAGLGYTGAIIQKNLEFRMEKFEMNQQFNEKLQSQIDECREKQQNLQNKRVEAVENLVKTIQKKMDGKQ